MPTSDEKRRGRAARTERPARRWRTEALCALLALALAAARPSHGQEVRPGPAKHVLFLDSYGREFSPYAELSALVRAGLTQKCGHPIEFFHVSLQVHGAAPKDEQPVADYVGALCSRRVPDLVVTTGGPAARFFAKHRDRFGPSTPVVHGGADARWLEGAELSPQETAVLSSVDIPAQMENILRARPRTREVVVVMGASPAEKFWTERFKSGWQPFASRVRLTWLDGLAFEEVLRRSAKLPPDSAIFFGLMITDAAGIPHEQQEPLERLRRVASAPIFSWCTIAVGHGIVGGRLVPIEEMAGEIAAVGVRVLHGVPPSSIPVKTVSLGGPVYDARELKRWGIDERKLPQGSDIRFREPSFFSLYRGRILGASAVILLQAVAIGALLEGRRRQRRAEQESARLRGELAHVGRVSVLGQLSSSLAHELSQPLGAILRNAEAAELFLASEAPDLAEIRSIVADIKADEHRAGNVIERMRGFLRRQEAKRSTLDPAALVEGVVTLVGPELRARGIRLETTVARELPSVTGDPVHLQQVLLNLLVNAMEAMEKTPRDARVLSVAVRAGETGTLEIAVGDSGPGVPAGEASRIFEPFHTTKPAGLGMGLAISRALVEAHGGHLRLEAKEKAGATFVVSLPAGDAPA